MTVFYETDLFGASDLFPPFGHKKKEFAMKARSKGERIAYLRSQIETYEDRYTASYWDEVREVCVAALEERIEQILQDKAEPLKIHSCKSCGAEPVVWSKLKHPHNTEIWYVMCGNLGCRDEDCITEGHVEKIDAIRAWNAIAAS